jgi:ribosome-associated protein
MHAHDHDDGDTPEYAGPSRTQRKKAVEALQDLGEELVKLSREQLDKFDLSDSLYEAIREAQRITSHGATRRQMQLIGKLMRSADAEAIAEQLAAIKGVSDAAKAEFHALERWRERLINDDDALTEWLAAHPDSDATQLRQLIRNARKEAAEGKPPKSSRALFKLIRDGR